MDELGEPSQENMEHPANVPPQMPAYVQQMPQRPSAIELLMQNKVKFFAMLGFLFLLIGTVLWSVGFAAGNSRMALQHVVAPIFLEIAVFFILLSSIEGLLNKDTEPFVKLILGFLLLFLVIMMFVAFAVSMVGMFAQGGL